VLSRYLQRNIFPRPVSRFAFLRIFFLCASALQRSFLFSAPLAESPQPSRRAKSGDWNRAGARKLVLTAAIRAPHLRQKTIWQFAPTLIWIATKVNFQLNARLQPIRSRLPLPERSCAGSVSFLSRPRFSTQRHDRFVGERLGNPSQADASGTVFRQNEDYPISRASPPGFSPR